MGKNTLKARLLEDTKAAMKGGEKSRLAIIRLINAAIKQQEVDERIELNDTQVIAVLDKMSKQRRESIEQFKKADRKDLIEQEVYELDVIKDYMPEQLSEDEISQLVNEAISTIGAASIRDMGKVMAFLKPKLQGRADMAKVSGTIKSLLQEN